MLSNSLPLLTIVSILITDMKAAFLVFDWNNDGEITPVELKRVLSLHGDPRSGSNRLLTIIWQCSVRNVQISYDPDEN